MKAKKEIILSKQDRIGYLDAVSQEIFHTDYDKLDSNQQFTLRLSLGVRQRFNEFSEDVFKQLLKEVEL